MATQNQLLEWYFSKYSICKYSAGDLNVRRRGYKDAIVISSLLLIYQVDFGRITQVVTTVEFVYTFKSECDAQPTRQGTFQI